MTWGQKHWGMKQHKLSLNMRLKEGFVLIGSFSALQARETIATMLTMAWDLNTQTQHVCSQVGEVVCIMTHAWITWIGAYSKSTGKRTMGKSYLGRLWMSAVGGFLRTELHYLKQFYSFSVGQIYCSKYCMKKKLLALSIWEDAANGWYKQI